MYNNKKTKDYKRLLILFRDVSRDFLGITVFIGRVIKLEAEGIATLQCSNNIRCHKEI